MRSLVRHPRRSITGSSGFSVLELLIVIGILGIVAAVGTPFIISQLARIQLEAAARDVANLLNQTRLRAIRDNEEYTVQVIGTSVFGQGLIETGVPLELQFTDPQATIYSVGPVPCTNTDIVFRSNGAATDVGEICLWDSDDNVLQVALLFESGQPKIRKYLEAADAPSGAGFYEKTSRPTADVIWTWY